MCVELFAVNAERLECEEMQEMPLRLLPWLKLSVCHCPCANGLTSKVGGVGEW